MPFPDMTLKRTVYLPQTKVQCSAFNYKMFSMNYETMKNLARYSFIVKI